MRSWIIPTWIALVVVSPASARTFTLHEAVTDAVVRSDAVAAAEAKSAGAKAQADEALAMLFPALTFSGGWAHLDTAPYTDVTLDPAELFSEDLIEMLENFAGMEVTEQTFRLYMGKEDNFQFQLQAEQIVFAGTALHRQRAMKIAQLRSAEEEERIARHEVAYQAEHLFWQLALARQAMEVTAQAIQTAETHVGLLEAFVEVGLASEADLMAAKVQLASLRLTELQTRQGASLAENAFRTIVHVPDDEAVELDLSQGGMPLQLPADPDAVAEVARESRPEMRMLGHQHDSTRHAAGAAWSSWLPQIAVYGNVYLKNPDRALEPNFYWSADFMVGLQWKLWDRGAALYRNRQARAGLNQIDAMRRQLRDGIELEIDQAHAALREAEEQETVAGEAVELAQESLRLVQLNFGEGMARNVDVLEAQTALSKARLDALEAQIKYRIAEAGLRKAVGMDLEGN